MLLQQNGMQHLRTYVKMCHEVCRAKLFVERLTNLVRGDSSAGHLIG